MLAPALGRDVRQGPLDDLEQRLLDALAGDVPGDGGAARLAGDLVDLVDVDDALGGSFHVIVRVLQETQDDVLHVLAHVARLGERGGVRDGEGHVEHPGEGARQERLAGARGPDEQDVALLQLHAAQVRLGEEPLVVVVDGHGENLFRALLPDDVGVQELLDVLGLGDLLAALVDALDLGLLLDDAAAQLDALVADVGGRACHELLDLILGLPAEGAEQDPLAALVFSLSSRHVFLFISSSLSAASGSPRR
ncbi:MAG: hypothetical protein A4E67_00381 [Syntrophaceae bacterium PtaB.Bin038]|nr:MAG: hypothetical protein A4E67_00381 [Syntrophaceae bacterium PtaB.Bin038]